VKADSKDTVDYHIRVFYGLFGEVWIPVITDKFNACAFMSEYGQLKYWEGVAPYPDGTPAGETPSVIVLDR